MLRFRILGCGHRQKVAVILLQGYVRELFRNHFTTKLSAIYDTVLDSCYAKVIQSGVKYVMPLSPILIESLCNLTCSLLNTQAPVIVSIIIIKCSSQPVLNHHNITFIESYIALVSS